MTIHDLIELADKILSEDPLLPEIVDKIQMFFDGLEDILPSLEKNQKNVKAEVSVLFEKHEGILKLTSTLREDTSHKIRELKRRGKGILAYRYNLPKRISLGKPIKG